MVLVWRAVKALLGLKFEKDCSGRTESHTTIAGFENNVPAVVHVYSAVSKADM